MSSIQAPHKPFPSYKWRWATLTPTESLNLPSIYIGALRIFLKHNNYSPSAKEVQEGLAIVQRETSSPVDLVRSTDRNLIRNSGQYWSALGLLDRSHGQIHVTRFGKDLCDGHISQTDFAVTVVKTLELPNRNIMSPEECKVWDLADLKIRPLQLLLEIMFELNRTLGGENAYITNEELVNVVIPLAGNRVGITSYVTALHEYRNGRLYISDWPNCAPAANDRRMAREFLLFLSNYGFCKIVGANSQQQKFVLADISAEEFKELQRIKIERTTDIDSVSRIIRESDIPAQIERRKTARVVLERPYQGRFRENVLKAYEGKCLLTGVSLGCVLEAAHIIPVSYHGNDLIENGICLRVDIHQLFDNGHIKISPSGNIWLSDKARRKENYQSLLSDITIPKFVNPSYLDWRLKYT